MIYTVTFNPSLDYIVSVDDFKLGLTNRTSSELILPGGKGTNVSTVLKNLGLESTALGFVAGFTGNEIVKRLNDMGIKSDFISIENGILNNCTFVTTSGDIEFDGQLAGDNALETTSGDVSVENINNVSVTASTTSGDIEIGEEEFTGSVNKVLGTSNATLKLNTTSGDIEVN